MEANPVTHPECRRACQYNRSMVGLNHLRVVMVVVTGYSKEARLTPVGTQTYTNPDFLAFHSHFQVTSGEMMSLRDTSGHARSHDVITCQVTATSRELQPCKSSNIYKT